MTKRGIYKNCEKCDKSFYAFPHESNQRRFCSQICSNKTTNIQVSKTKRQQSIEKVAVNDRKWRYSFAYRQWRTAVFERDNFTCTNCGSGMSLIAHHVKSYKDFPKLRIDISNGITLCRSCHNRHDKGIIASQF